MTYLIALFLLAAVVIAAIVKLSAPKAVAPAAVVPAPAPVVPVEVPAPAPAPAPTVVDLLIGGGSTPPAGTSAPVLPSTSTRPGDPNFVFVPQGVMTFEYCRGQNIPADGPTQYTITDCPAQVYVMAVQASARHAGPFTVTANGASASTDNPDAAQSVPASGPTVVITINQAADSHLTLAVRG